MHHLTKTRIKRLNAIIFIIAKFTDCKATKQALLSVYYQLEKLTD